MFSESPYRAPVLKTFLRTQALVMKQFNALSNLRGLLYAGCKTLTSTYFVHSGQIIPKAAYNGDLHDYMQSFIY